MSTTPAGTDLVANPATGELLDLTQADTEQLAAAIADLDDLRADLTQFETTIESELLRRLDRDLKWTLRVGDPAGTRQLEIKAPSPSAGTDSYDPVLLDAELDGLIARGTISPDGAARALQRTLTVTVRVGFGHDLAELQRKVQAVDAIAGIPVEHPVVTASRKVTVAGINALRKIDGTGRALDRAAIKTPAPRRRARVKTVHR